MIFLFIEPFLELSFPLGLNYNITNPVWVHLIVISVCVFIGVWLPWILMKNIIRVVISNDQVIISQPLLFRNRRIDVKDVRGYSIGVNFKKVQAEGIVKLYAQIGKNYQITNSQVGRLGPFVKALQKLEVTFLGHEESSYSWKGRNFDRLKYLYDDPSYHYELIDEDRKTIDNIILKREGGKTPYFISIVSAFILFVITSIIPFMDLSTRRENYHLSKYAGFAQGRYYSCKEIIGRYGDHTGKRMVKYEFYVNNVRYTGRKRDVFCPKKYSIVDVKYSTKDPSINEVVSTN